MAWLAAVLLLGPLAHVVGGETPVVSAFDAGPVGRISATFNGELSAGLNVTVTVRWGTDQDAWSHTNSVTVWTNVMPHRLSYAATGLDAGLEYHYQFHATNTHGHADSAVKTFTTASGTDRSSGGAFDGYDLFADRHGFDYPQVRNAAAGATNVTGDTAWLNGMLLTAGIAPISAVRVFYGKTDGGTDTNEWVQNFNFGAVDEMAPLTVNVSVDGGSTYYYRFYAINTGNQEGWASSSVTFRTPSAPEVSSTTASPLGRVSTTLHGILTAGLTADITFYWGPDSNAWAYTNAIGWWAEGPLALPVTGLVPGQTYAFQITAQNNYGDIESAVIEFTTQAETVRFAGGAFDGYDHVAEFDLHMGMKGSLILIR